VRAYLRSFVYLKFQQILANLVRRAKGTQRHIRSIAAWRGATRRVASRMDNFITRRGGLPIARSRLPPPLRPGAGGGRAGPCRRNYTIKRCPDGRQLGASVLQPILVVSLRIYLHSNGAPLSPPSLPSPRLNTSRGLSREAVRPKGRSGPSPSPLRRILPLGGCSTCCAV